jgi:bla regulator protein blaR1
MNSIESWLLSCLVNSLWQIPVLFVAGLVAARALRRLGPEAEHRTWTTLLVLSAALPVASSIPFGGLLTGFTWSPSPNPGDAHVTVLMGPGSTFDRVGFSSILFALAAWAYAVLCLWFAARFLWRCLRLNVIRRDASRVTLAGETAASWLRCSRRLGIKDVAVATSSRTFGPVTFGVAHKLVVLPSDLLATAEAADLNAVIAHEFAHIRRNDFLKNLICECIALPVNYHPLFWAIRERVMESREMVCDAMAAEPGCRTQYARSLLRLASLLLQGQPVTTPHAIGIFDANTLERRLMRLTEASQPIRGLRRIAMVGVCAVFGLGIGSAALALHVRVDGQPTDSNPSHPSGPIAVSPKIMQGQRISGPMPVYPPEAKKARIQGMVLLGVVINEQGTVENVHVLSGEKEQQQSTDEVDRWTGHKYPITSNAALQQSAIDAVKQWTYKPFLLNGEPVAVKTTVHVIYSLSK